MPADENSYKSPVLLVLNLGVRNHAQLHTHYALTGINWHALVVVGILAHASGSIPAGDGLVGSIGTPIQVAVSTEASALVIPQQDGIPRGGCWEE